jgi:hypothetical protein
VGWSDCVAAPPRDATREALGPVKGTSWPSPAVVDALGAIACLAIALLIPWLYVHREHTFYAWDYRYFADNAARVADDLRTAASVGPTGWLPELRRIWLSTERDYSDLAVLPVAPLTSAFGTSRLAFVSGLALTSVLPFALASGVVAAQVIGRPGRPVFWSAALLTLLTPAAWVPALRGYPDASGGALLFAAILAYLPQRSLRTWRQAGLIGVPLALAVLTRRHFVYPALAYFISTAAFGLLEIVRLRRQPGRALTQAAAYLAGLARVGLISLLTLGLIGAPFLVRLSGADFGRLYASYAVAPGSEARFFAAIYGWSALGLAGLGLLARRARGEAAWLALYALVALGLWLVLARQTDPQYTLQFTPVVVTGLIALAYAVWDAAPRRARLWLLGTASAYLVLNLGVGLGAIRVADSPWLRSALATDYPPLVRTDYQAVLDLVSYLHGVAAPGDPIYVAASSEAVNHDVLRAADRDSHPLSEWLDFIYPPEVDSRDAYPLEDLAQARLVIVVTPFQQHLGASEQTVVQAVVETFTQRWEIARDFTRLPAQFTLGDNLAVAVYRRDGPTSAATAVQDLDRLRRTVGRRPGCQPDWALVTPPPTRPVGRNAERLCRLPPVRLELPATADSHLVYVEPVAQPARVAGWALPLGLGCPALALELRLLDASGRQVGETQIANPASSDGAFAATLTPTRTAYLVLNPRGATAASGDNPGCRVSLRGLSLAAP